MNTISNTPETPIFTDIYSLMHFQSGVFFYVLLFIYFNFSLQKSFILWIIIHTIYEIKDYIGSYHINVKNEVLMEMIGGNSLYNSVGDTLYAILGFFTIHIICLTLYNYSKINKKTLNLIIMIVISVITFICFYSLILKNSIKNIKKLRKLKNNLHNNI